MHYGINVVGKTTTEQNVYDGLGCFKIVESHGVPLDLLLDKMKSQNAVIELTSFLEAAINQGWSFETILRKMEEGYVDVYGKSYWEEISVRVKMVLVRTL